MGRIGILADTHIIGGIDSLPEEIRRELSTVDLIIHAGDVTPARLLRDLGSLTPVVYCTGNCDPPDLYSSNRWPPPHTRNAGIPITAGANAARQPAPINTSQT